MDTLCWSGMDRFEQPEFECVEFATPLTGNTGFRCLVDWSRHSQWFHSDSVSTDSMYATNCNLQFFVPPGRRRSVFFFTLVQLIFSKKFKDLLAVSTLGGGEMVFFPLYIRGSVHFDSLFVSGVVLDSFCMFGCVKIARCPPPKGLRPRVVDFFSASRVALFKKTRSPDMASSSAFIECTLLFEILRCDRCCCFPAFITGL